MTETLHFIFSSFWNWLGAVILTGVLVNGIVGIINTLGHFICDLVYSFRKQ